MQSSNGHEEPLVSIGITAYNALCDIDQAIKSAINQNWFRKELIVVDDQSSDGTWEHLQKTYSNVARLIRNEKNSGVAVSRNRIIEAAKGEFLTFFDDDDISDLNRIKSQVLKIKTSEKKNPKVKWIVCHTGRRQLLPDGSWRIEATIDNQQGEPVAQRILYGRHFKGDNVGSVATCSQMARIEVYRDIGGFDPFLRRFEDTDFAIRVALADGLFVGVSEPLVTQRITLTNDKKKSDQLIYWKYIIQKNKDFLLKHGQFEHAEKWIDLKYQFYDGRDFVFVFKLFRLFLRNPIMTILRIYWALPNIRFNFSFRKLYKF